MTTEEFKECVQEMLADCKDPNGELANLKEEGIEMFHEIEPHDPVMAGMIMQVCNSIGSLMDYVKSRAEG